MIPDPIPTERLTLRPLTAGDEAALLRFRLDRPAAAGPPAGHN